MVDGCDTTSAQVTYESNGDVLFEKYTGCPQGMPQALDADIVLPFYFTKVRGTFKTSVASGTPGDNLAGTKWADWKPRGSSIRFGTPDSLIVPGGSKKVNNTVVVSGNLSKSVPVLS